MASSGGGGGGGGARGRHSPPCHKLASPNAMTQVLPPPLLENILDEALMCLHVFVLRGFSSVSMPCVLALNLCTSLNHFANLPQFQL